MCGGVRERSPERANSRNSYRERACETRGGSVELKIPNRLFSGVFLSRVARSKRPSSW
jgi:transposase-like protein